MQDINDPPTELETMKKATLISIAVTILFNMLCGCLGYAAFGDLSLKKPINWFRLLQFLLASQHSKHYHSHLFINDPPTELLQLGMGAYQVYCQSPFALIEKEALKRWSENILLTKEIEIPIFGFRPYKLNLSRLSWRSAFVVITTVLCLSHPFMML